MRSSNSSRIQSERPFFFRPKVPTGSGAMAGVGHEDQFAPPGPSGRCRFGQATFTGTHGNERNAPIAGTPVLPLLLQLADSLLRERVFAD
jgi:hypothetical protein